jgi:outer membrane protein assembly factor BamE (lipoprotein component of BamABCDE complex)
MRRKYLLLMVLIASIGCASANVHRRNVQDDTGDRLTVGTVQRNIKVGMTSAQVIEALGSPNVVTTDEERREVWVYDKIATDVTYSQSEGESGLFLILAGVGGSGSSGSRSTSQRTLTVVVKFDKENKVRDFAYHSSKF